ncbi:hypothetical protein [Pyruvatibacter mobilis]|uniref:hypothetical protein n=1 Tax=Pyruvatibacter mobilis TaxID=1712261 RepID=UPI003BB1E510
MMNVFLLLTLFLFFVTLLFLRRLLIRYAAISSVRGAMAEKFYDRAQQIMKHEATTDSIADATVMVGRAQRDGRFMRAFAFVWVSGQLAKATQEGPVSQFGKDLIAAPADLQALVGEALSTGLINATYASPLFGYIVRKFLLKSVGMPSSTADAPRFTGAMMRQTQAAKAA